MIKIEYIIGSLEVGGAERHLSQVLPVLSRIGYSITVQVLSHKAPLKPLFDSAGINVRLGRNFDWLPGFVRRPVKVMDSLLKLIFSFLKNRDAIRHVFLPEAYMLTSIAARMTFFSGPLVMSRRSLNDYQKRRPLLGMLERAMHRFTTIALGNSKAVVQQLYEEGFESGRVGLIYNGIDATAFEQLPSKNVLRENLNINQDALIFIIVANLIPYKGHQDLFNAFGLVYPQLPENWKLLCVGYDSGIMKDLKKQAKSLGIEAHVDFLGKRSDTAQLLAASDIGILCSHEEGFSNAILEAMAAGLPMIVTDVGGNAEAIDDMQTGLVVPPKKPRALADAILSLFFAADLRTHFANNSKIKIEQNFTLEQCVKKYMEIYVSLSKIQNDER